MISSRTLTTPRRAPSEVPHPLGAAVREALRAPRRVWVFNVVLALACALMWVLAIGSFDVPAFGRGPTLSWYWLALAFYLAEILVVHLQFRKQAHTISLTEIGLTLGLLLGSPSSLLIGQLAGTFVALVVNRRRSQLRQLAKFAFNLAELPLCSGIGLLVFRALASPADSAPHLWVLVLVACAVAHVVGILLVSTVIAIAEERFQAPQLGRTLVTSTLGASRPARSGSRSSSSSRFARSPSCSSSSRRWRASRRSAATWSSASSASTWSSSTSRCGRRRARRNSASPSGSSSSPRAGCSAPSTPRSCSYRPQTRKGPCGASAAPRESCSCTLRSGFRRPTPPRSARCRRSARRCCSPAAAPPTRSTRSSVRAGSRTRSSAPLRGEDRTFGLLVVGERLGDVSTFAEADVELLGTFAGHASILLENGRLEHSLAQVTQLKEQLRHQAYHDALTGLPNRLYLLEAVEQELERGTGSTAVLYLDLDRFKTVNDTWGHSAGDELLSRFARRLARRIRAQDLAARLGGDEFAVLVREADAEAAVVAARRMLDAIEGTYTLGCGDVACHVSVGIAVGAAATTSGEDLIRNADIAMYSVKRSERTFTLYEADLHEKLRAQRQLALDLEAALERREILVHYQPVVRLADGQIEGFEVLARWPHPTRGFLSAADFLPAAEEAGLTVELGRLVLAAGARSRPALAREAEYLAQRRRRRSSPTSGSWIPSPRPSRATAWTRAGS